MPSLPSADNRRQKLELCSLFKLHDPVCHLVYSLPADRFPTLRAVRNPDPGVQQTEVVVNFCHRTYCGSGISVGGFLVDGNSGGQTFNTVYIRLFHLSEKLSCIGGQRLHVSSLPFRINCIECQGRFPGTAQSCENNELVSGYY